ncbi:hypothetical protein DL768_009576 [Monosporascus sp. mg162]|nr:hypothetical protein DL768_009576 [Monosporascus sp. mg162]
MSATDICSGQPKPQIVPSHASEANMKAQFTQMPIAIIGMACRLPGSCNTPKAFWDLLERGGVASRTPPATRFRVDTHNDNSKKRNTMASPGGMFIDADPRDMDASFFKLPRAEAVAMDPQQRQLLEVVYEGLENAGLTMEEIDGQAFGCFVGSYACDYGDIQSRDPEDRAHFTTLGTGRAMLSNRISHFLNIKGPSMTIDTACSGSLIGVDLGNRYLQTGEISGAIVAGCNIYLSPEHVMDGLSANGTASLSGLCHSFDAKADGYIKAEAVNMVVLKRLNDAIRDRNPIRAVIRGTATGSDGWTAGIASPNSAAQAATIQQAYANANITDLSTTSYVECHGTGTRAGDAIEIAGVATVFSSVKSDNDPLRIGSVKSNIGHSEPAAGISGLLKVVLSLENQIIPGNPTFETPNPSIDFRGSKVRASRTATRWGSPAKLRRAGVNSFGYGGSNAHAVVESAGGLTNHVNSYTSNLFAEEMTYDRPYVLVFSANDELSLRGNVVALDRHLTYPGVSFDLRDLAYTLSEKRTRHFHRGYIVTDKTEITVGLLSQGKVTRQPRIGLIFTGQGAQWPQMGKDLISVFPVVKGHLARLNDVLQNLNDGPQWSLLEELSQPRNAEHYRLPELSQTLVTALQLAILALLENCKVRHHAVVGHSSGEIAAAVAAGFLTPEEAIKIAYYRGKAVGQVQKDRPLGMMAVGLSEEQAAAYLRMDSRVEIACINSPGNITLSGDHRELLELEEQIKNDGHFARMLLVDAAYHSRYMATAGMGYRKYLLDNCEWTSSTMNKAAMYSSVEGRRVSSLDGAAYWERNMISPVRFNTAVQEMLKEPLDMLIEIGPSNALSGPIHQIKESIGSKIEYAAAWKRDAYPAIAFCHLAGNLFIKDSSINLMHFNADNSEHAPAVIVDLPNYCWNHSTKYWHESTASKDWRFRKFVHHDLLGSKILGTPWQQPAWRKMLRVQDVPWLRDHRVGESIIFPAAGYLAMAIEASFQMQKAVNQISQDTASDEVTYHLRNCRFLKAMSLEDNGAEYEMLLTLTPRSGPENGWLEFVVRSSVDDSMNDHSRGLVRVREQTVQKTAAEAEIKPLQHPTSARLWYKAMREVGYRFGPAFQKSLFVESTVGSRRSRSILSFQEPASAKPQSTYPLHPTNIDACFQAVAGSIWAGDRTAVNVILVPDVIDELVIPAQKSKAKVVIATSMSNWTGLGNINDAKSFTSDVSAFDQETHALVHEMRGLRYQSLEAEKSKSDSHAYTRSLWAPDISFLSQTHLDNLLRRDLTAIKGINKLLDMVAFKKPEIRVLEINTNDQSESLWIDGRDTDSFDRNAACSLQLVVSSPQSFTKAGSRYQGFGNTTVRLAQDVSPFKTENNFDVLITDDIAASGIWDILNAPRPPNYVIIKTKTKENIVNRAVVRQQRAPLQSHHLTNDPSSNRYTPDVPDILRNIDLVRTMQIQDSSARFFFGVTHAGGLRFETPAAEKQIDLLQFNSIENTAMEDTVAAVRQLGWEVRHHRVPFTTVQPGNKLLILDELFTPVLASIAEDQWTGLQTLLSQDCRVLWASRGAQMAVTNPDCSLAHGFARSIMNENPNAIIMTLDVESSLGMGTVMAINQILHLLTNVKDSPMGDTEFIERGGVLHIGRIVPDRLMNDQEMMNVQGPEAKDLPLFNHESCVRLTSDRLGTLESLRYTEITKGDIPLLEGEVEVDIHSVSLNFKDLAVTMGLVPGNEQLLGLDGAGVIRRLGKGTGGYYIGQRVLANRKGSLANRVQCTVNGEIFPIPENVSFEVASTLNTVYSTALYALVDLCGIQQGQSVLVHSAAGGLGIAAVQICNYFGAEVYATVGSNEKRRFLTENYNVRPNRIFSSRTPEFAADLMAATSGKGVDVILNSLAGEMLHASWHCIANGGTFVELGKKDILDRASISMEPFNRNASYRAADMSHESISSNLKSRLLSRSFDLLKQGHIKPVIHKVFSFEDAQAAFRLLSTGTVIGKIVVARNDTGETIVPVRPATPKFLLDSEGSYLIVGGLKGLCGSMAVYLARQGAKSLVVLSRSGYQDETSEKVASDIRSLGAELCLIIGDVLKIEDIDRAFQSPSKPIRGIIQGAMVLRDKMYSSMTQVEFREAVLPKVRGTWNLHNSAIKHGFQLHFFTLLSSICGVVGQKGQANYSAANAFLDAFAAYRKSLNLPACSVDLGVVEDVGYVNNRESLGRRLLAQGWAPIDEILLHKILYFSILQQQRKPVNAASSHQLITGIPVPLPKESPARRDARFSTLRHIISHEVNSTENVGDDMAMLRNAFKAGRDRNGDHEHLLAVVTAQANRRLMRSLGLTEDIDPKRPISSYGIDSLVAVEFRNWARVELGVEIATLEVVGAKSLMSLCKLILKKGLVRNSGNTQEKTEQPA